MRHALLVALVLALGCADGTGTLTLTVAAKTNVAVTGIDHLRVRVTDKIHARTSKPIDFPLPARPGTIPPEQKLTLRSPSDLRGLMTVVVEAHDAKDTLLVSGSADVTITPSKASALTILLAGQQTGTGNDPDPAISTVVAAPASVPASGADASTITVTLLDASGAPVSGRAVTLTATGSGNLLTQPMVSDAHGVATGAIASTVAEVKTITATADPSIVLSQMPTVQFTASAVATLAFIVQPSNVYQYTTLSPPIQIGFVDGSGNPIGNAAPNVKLTLGTSPGGARLLNAYPHPAATNGRTTFDQIGFDTVGSYTLTATVDGVGMVTSNSFTVATSPWGQITNGIYGGTVALVPDPKTTGAVYAFSPSALFASINSGANWSAMTAFGLPRGNIVGFGIATQAPNAMYVLSSVAQPAAQPLFVLSKSVDGGISFALLPTLPKIDTNAALLVDPNVAGSLYLADWSGILRSSDDGQTWTRVLDHPATGQFSLAIDPANSSYAWAGAFGVGVYASSDGATTWSAVANGLTAQPARLAAQPGWVYASDNSNVARLQEGQTTWTSLSPGLSNITSLSACTSGADVYVANSSGAIVHNPTNGTGSWSNVPTTGLPTTNINNKLAIDATACGQLYAATQSRGVFELAAGAVSWTADSNGLSATTVYGFATGSNPTEGIVVYAATDAGLFKTDDAFNWTVVPAVGSDIDAVALKSTDSKSIWAASQVNSKVWYTTNGGTSWSSTAVSLVTSLVAAPTTPATVWIGLGGDALVMKSTDGGATFAAAATNLSVFPGALALDPTTPIVYAAGTSNGIYKTTDAAATTWALLYTTADRLTTLAVDPTAPAKLLAAPAPTGGIFRSIDGGANWSNVAASPTQASVPWLAFLNSAASAYAVSTANELLGSSDGGASWTQLGTVPNVSPTTLAVSPVDLKSVFLGTTGAGVYVTRSGGK